MNHRIPSSLAAAMGPFALVTIFVAGCGQSFSLTGGTGGGGGASATAGTSTSTSGSGTTTSSSTSSASSTGSGSPGCNWSVAGKNACGQGEYCDDTSCGKMPGAGTCKPKGSPQAGDNPVCGCDGLTYWNGTLAASRGIPAQHNVVCPNELQKACGSSTACPPGTNVYCRKVDQGCDGNPQGACWVLPNNCNSTTEQVKECPGGQVCVNACNLIKLGQSHDQTCSN